jgi:hypothetical protein
VERNRMRTHVTLVAAMRIGFGVLGILTAMIAGVAIVGGGLISGDSVALSVTSVVGPAVALFLVVLPILGTIGGIGLLMGKPWARILVLILAVLDLFQLPIGTIIGIYTIWVLLHDETAQLFARSKAGTSRT